MRILALETATHRLSVAYWDDGALVERAAELPNGGSEWLLPAANALLEEAGITMKALDGIAFGAGWTPCVGPALSSILVLSADQGTVAQGVILLIAYSAGIGVPFILAAFVIERLRGLIMRIGPYQATIQKVVGAIILLVGILLFTDNLATIGQWMENAGLGWDLGL